ncbi:MAG: prolyl oligopeptidase family serine peptidase [Actinobacteria bacterium]|nr:prolyl oligopeptidase family serine peptidase [Actinomycetota bacterium]MBW3651129.1 prolyl oligopeptidase family serine peptidase [Actinomycetota bacterium]
MATTASFGSWSSPITSDLLVEKVVRLSQVLVDGEDVYWNESRPAEGGRQVVVRRTPSGALADVLPAGFSARTLVHEYGGQSFAVWRGTVFFSNFDDQRLYRITAGDGDVRPLTAEPTTPRSERYADPVVTPDGSWLVCVRERHLAGEVVNDVVAVPTEGGGAVVLAEGHDFFAAPRLSADGSKLCWLSWDHPNMPWDGTELWAAPLADGRLAGEAHRVAGGTTESISQPRWSPDGRLHYVSDATGWWNLYAADGEPGAKPTPLVQREAEFSGPDWVFGQSTYAFFDHDLIVASWSEAGSGRFGTVGPEWLQEVPVPYSSVESVQPVPGGVVVIAGSPSQAPAVVRVSLPSGDTEVLRRSREDRIDGDYLSEPEALEFPTEGGLTAFALYYPPRNRDFEAPVEEKPPLVVMSHGGPTSATSSVLNLAVQYFTSRGMAVVDVNYGGSTGYGREYRERLRGRWGVVDVDDCVNAALHLADHGLVDRNRLVIRGASAGGYTTLAALTFRDTFTAGASHYGVADVEALAKDTHKFESRYLDGLIGPYPASRALYVERSPIHHTHRLQRPMILFQGVEDEVVPPEQAEMMAAALRAKGIPFAYLAFEGEQHGFRRAETIKRVAEAEVWFYGRILGFSPSDEIDPVPLENEEALPLQ